MTAIHQARRRERAERVRPRPDLQRINRDLKSANAATRVRWALDTFDDHVVLSSSFGVQAAVMLHLVTRQAPEIPVVLVDTGYLFPETYRFVDELTNRLRLNLRVFRSEVSPAWLEARHGRLWEQGLDGIERFNRISKIDPMRRALEELEAQAWMTGLRRQQSRSRSGLSVVAEQNGRLKVHPIIDWTERDVHEYLSAHDLPYHPLWHEGYVSVGDVPTTRRLADGMEAEEARFFGLHRECGLHELV